ncbi:alpha/beta hydrolase [Nocardia sp. 004]|uniref:alpha/beta hydrolase n=1 Tax=Nocardia sp. 004 TaxID=3385978 RepID=UPI00399F6C7F
MRVTASRYVNRQVVRARGRTGWLPRLAVSVVLAILLPFGVSVAGAGYAGAAFDPDGFDFWVDSGMGPIKSRVFRAADGNTQRVVYALDGMRAREDLNGWEIDTEVARELTKWNINVVMPVGGRSSFYTDWEAPSTFLGVPAGSGSGSGSASGSGGLQVFADGPGKSYTYTWETFLTQNLPAALRDRLGFSPIRNGVFGLSMSGSSALALAAYHPGQFSFAGSFSGALNLSAPTVREAVRLAMLDAGGYNVDAMAPPWSPKWLRLDPFVFAPQLVANKTRLWIAAGSGLPTPGDPVSFDTGTAMGIEAIVLAQTRAFQARMLRLGADNVVYSFPPGGVHNWRNWENEVYRMLPELSANIG